MKRGSLLLLASSLVSVAPFFACDSGSTPAATPDASAPDSASSTPDGSSFPAPDGGAPGADAGPSGTDAGTDAGPQNTATVTVLRDGAPEAGVSVVFQDAAGAVVSTVVTGADGKATSTVAAGSQLTVALGGSVTGRQLLTYLGVKPGDAIRVDDPDQRFVSVPIATLPPGNTGATVVLGNFNCATNSIGTTAGIFLTPDCIQGATFPVIEATYVGSQNGYWFAWKKGNTPAASGTTNVSGLSAWALFGSTFTLNVTNAPAATQTSAYLGQIANGEAFDLGPTNTFTVAGGAASGTFDIATGYPDALQGEVVLVSSLASPRTGSSYAQRVASTATSQSFDLASALLPYLLTATIDSTTPARPIATWTSAAALTGTDSGAVRFSWTSPVDGGGTEKDAWTFVVPPGTMTVTAPALPAQLSAWVPGAVVSTPSVAFFESDLLAGYDAARGQAAAFGLTSLPVPGYSALAPALPAAGTVRVTALSP